MGLLCVQGSASPGAALNPRLLPNLPLETAPPGRVRALPDGFLALEFCRHGLHNLTEAQAAIDAALIELLVVFPVL